MFLPPCADLNALSAVESYYSGKIPEKGASLARSGEFLLFCLLALISDSDRNEKLLLWLIVPSLY